jgi:hypothetical protein
MLEKIKQEFSEMQQENSKMMNKLELKVKRMQCCLDNNPLLDLVSRFRFEIIKELKIDKKIPSDFNDWNLVQDYLKGKQNLHAIDDTAKKLGFSESDWDYMKYHCKHDSNLKHSEQRISKEGTKYNNCATPLTHLIDLFEKNNR